MTKSARCRGVERLMLEGEDRALGAEERRTVEEHLRGCGRCRGFASDRALIRGELGAAGWPEPPDGLVLRTRRLARERGAEPERASLPAWIYVALAAVTIATGVWLTFALAGVTPDMTLADLPVAALAALFIIAQNTLTLLCAPVVLRAFRARPGAAPGGREM